MKMTSIGTNMQLSEIKMLFDNGALRDASVSRAVMQDGWCVSFGRVGRESVTMDTQRGSVRVFKTLDAAAAVVEEIGFRIVLVVFRGVGD